MEEYSSFERLHILAFLNILLSKEQPGYWNPLQIINVDYHILSGGMVY